MKNSNRGHPNPVRTTTSQRVYANTNPVTQPRVYNEPLPLAGGMRGTISLLLRIGTNRGHQIPQPFMQPPPPPPNLEAIREVIQEPYWLGLRQVGYPEFYNSYPEVIDRENPYPRGYRIPEFSLFSGENG